LAVIFVVRKGRNFFTQLDDVTAVQTGSMAEFLQEFGHEVHVITVAPEEHWQRVELLNCSMRAFQPYDIFLTSGQAAGGASA
jgi:hypothetical protein